MYVTLGLSHFILSPTTLNLQSEFRVHFSASGGAFKPVVSFMAKSQFALPEDESDSAGEDIDSEGSSDLSDASSDKELFQDQYQGPGEVDEVFEWFTGCCRRLTYTSALVFGCPAGAVEEEIAVCAAHQQRLAAAVAMVLQDCGPAVVGPNLKPLGFDWEKHVERMSEADFKLRYRLTWDSFNNLLKKLQPHLDVANGRQAVNARSGLPIPVEARLAVALRYFAGGDPKDLQLIYDMSKCQVMICVWRAVDAINSVLDNMTFERDIDDPEALRALEEGFCQGTRGGFWRGQVGAIDGVHIAMQSPTAADVEDPNRYHVARKDKYALLAVAICDYERRFTWADISHTPTTHDSTAWAATKLGQRVENGALPHPYFLNGDAAFAVGPCMITPSNNEASMDDFDFYQSSNRMAIECAFGILIRRWGVLWRPLNQRFDRRSALIFALMRLHNFCISERLSEGDLPEVYGVRRAQVQPGRARRPPLFDKDGRPVEFLDTCRAHDEGAPTRGETAQHGAKMARRDELAEAVRLSGYKRPRLAEDKTRKPKKPRGGGRGQKRK